MRLPGLVRYLCACAGRERETERRGWVYVCVRVDVWEAVIWCMGVGVKADRMKIVIILVPSIQPINHIQLNV